MVDPRLAEYRAAAEEFDSGLHASVGAHERYRQSLLPYVECMAEHSPKHVRPHVMRALFEQGLPLGVIAVGFRASDDELAPISNLPEIQPEPVGEAERLSGLPYGMYLKTSHWTKVKAEALKRAENGCLLCNSPQRLEVHHRSYKSLGRERPADVVVLCASCHSRHHGTLRAA